MVDTTSRFLGSISGPTSCIDEAACSLGETRRQARLFRRFLFGVLP